MRKPKRVGASSHSVWCTDEEYEVIRQFIEQYRRADDKDPNQEAMKALIAIQQAHGIKSLEDLLNSVQDKGLKL